MIEIIKGKGKIKRKELIFTDGRNVKTRASYILLIDYLRTKDEDFLSVHKDLFDWLDAREIFLIRRQKENNGNLQCDYCGRKHLDIGGKEMADLAANNKNPNLATVDHIDPLANEGEKFNENNMAVACKKCNRTKSDKSLLEYYNCLSLKEQKRVSLLIKNKL